MELIEITEGNDALVQTVARFRVELRFCKGIVSKPNMEKPDGKKWKNTSPPLFPCVPNPVVVKYVVKPRFYDRTGAFITLR